MKRKASKYLCTLMAAILLIAAMIVPTAAASKKSKTSVADKMAANSAAWWVAHNAGDTKTCEKLHAENQKLASQAAGKSGSASFNSASGTWSVTTSSGDKISSSGSYSGGKSNHVTYTTTTSSGKVSSSSNSTYTSSSISAYKSAGGTNEGLETSYNNAASKVTSSGNYGTSVSQTTADEEAAVVKALLGLTDREAKQLQSDLEVHKQEYESAQAAYKAAVAAGDTDAAAAAKAQMDTAHAAAEAVRAEYNYTGDTAEVNDGGYYDDWGNPISTVSSGGGFYIIASCKITASCNEGGSITPSGIANVKKYADQTYTIKANDGFFIQSVIVDGVDKGALTTYTFERVTDDHTISITFAPSGKVELGVPVVTDSSGSSVSGGSTGGSIKSGYGIFADVPVTYSGVSEVKMVMTCDFGDGAKSIVMEETEHGTFAYPINAASPLGRRCVYIPVETADGAYTLTFTATAKNAAGEVLTDTKTATVAVSGNMYEDDFTGDS